MHPTQRDICDDAFKQSTLRAWLVPVMVLMILFMGNVYAIPEVFSAASATDGIDARRTVLFRYFHVYALICFASSYCLYIGRRFNRSAVIVTAAILGATSIIQVAFHWLMVWFWNGVEAGL